MPTPGFPDAQSLCETCGYPLRGLGIDAVCPECGAAVDASDPRHRTGHWGGGASFGTQYLRYAGRLIRGPRRFFRAMRVGGSNLAPRVFLLINAALVMTIWTTTALLTNGGDGLLWAWLGGMIGFKAVLVLTYVEVLGVRLFSGRRGWRVPVALAERVACCASLGWVPAGALASAGWLVGPGVLRGLWPEPGGKAFSVTEAGFSLAVALSVAGMLVFESLVWIGVRQVKYANAGPSPAGAAPAAAL